MLTVRCGAFDTQWDQTTHERTGGIEHLDHPDGKSDRFAAFRDNRPDVPLSQSNTGSGGRYESDGTCAFAPQLSSTGAFAEQCARDAFHPVVISVQVRDLSG